MHGQVKEDEKDFETKLICEKRHDSAAKRLEISTPREPKSRRLIKRSSMADIEKLAQGELPFTFDTEPPAQRHACTLQKAIAREQAYTPFARSNALVSHLHFHVRRGKKSRCFLRDSSQISSPALVPDKSIDLAGSVQLRFPRFSRGGVFAKSTFPAGGAE